MIDFANITKTLDGFKCHYFGTRSSYGSTIHCFGIFHPAYGVKEAAYNSEGKRLTFENSKWSETTATDCQIVKPPRKVEVTRWLGYQWWADSQASTIMQYDEEPSDKDIRKYHLIHVEKVTVTIEVPE